MTATHYLPRAYAGRRFRAPPILFADFTGLGQKSFFAVDNLPGIRAIKHAVRRACLHHGNIPHHSCFVSTATLECRFIAPLWIGSCPAFWPCSPDSNRPDNRRINVMEAWARDGEDRYAISLHMWNTPPPPEIPAYAALGCHERNRRARGRATDSATCMACSLSRTLRPITLIILKSCSTPRRPQSKIDSVFPIVIWLSTGTATTWTMQRRADMYVDYLRVFQFLDTTAVRKPALVPTRSRDAIIRSSARMLTISVPFIYAYQISILRADGRVRPGYYRNKAATYIFQDRI